MTFFGEALSLFWQIVWEIGSVFYESSVFILMGFALAGILNEFIPMQYVTRRLGKPGFRSIVWATILGAPLPLCSCGVLPTAVAMRRKGASKPAIASFLVSVPETGVDSIAITYGLMGPIMAVFRPIVAVVTALVAGIACLVITRNEAGPGDLDVLAELEKHDHDHDHDHHHHHHHHGNSRDQAEHKHQHPPTWRERIGSMTNYGFRTVLDEVAFWIVGGLVITGAMMALLPDDFFSTQLGLDGGILPMLLMALIGVPLYTCASMSTPIAAGLVVTGLSPGAALVYLLAGPATSIASLTIVGKLLGRRSMVAYISSILFVAICAGLILDLFAANQIREATVRTFDQPDGLFEIVFKLACSLVFLVMFIGSMRRKCYREPLRDIRKQGGLVFAGLAHVRRLALVLAVTALVVLTIPAMTLRVGVGQQGMILRFGTLVDAALPPGLYFHLPWPIDTTRVIDTELIRDTYIANTIGEFLTSDENVIAISSVLQYRVKDPYAFEFRGEQNVDLLRDLANRILVQEVLSRPIDEIYTVQRSNVERAYRSRLSQEVAALDQGIELVEARLEHVHAPASVHDSFRDVSSALEDRQRVMFEAEGEAIALVANARGRRDEVVATAEGEAMARVKIAEGRAGSFVPQAEALRQDPSVGRTRMRLETIERSLVRPRKYLNAVPGSQGVDLWINPEEEDIVRLKYGE